jgi:transposase
LTLGFPLKCREETQLTERELSRKANWRLAIIRHAQEVSGNVAFTCRYYGVNRQSYYKWLRRYEELGVDGLRDRSRRPLVCPHATKAAVIERIIYLRQNYHFGPFKIAMYLKRYHDISVSQSGVWRILRRLDLSRLPTSQRYKRHQERWKRYEKQRPGLSVQIDVSLPLASLGPRASTCLHQTSDPASQRQGRAFAPHRR